ncbi:MAG: MMPL family transporter, partial [Chloroflexi bacterium]|nr:MMPL family transporter [Chloroflexota bacterium]
MKARGVAENLPVRVAAELERRSTWLIAAVVLLTALLVLPVVFMPPAGSASDNPGGPVYDLEAQVNRDLPPHVHGVFFLVETRDGGNVLEQPVLLEMFQNTTALLRADAAGELAPPGLPSQSYLYNGFDADRQRPVLGIFTFADAVNEVLARHPLLGVTLAEANGDQVKLAVSQVMSDPRTAAYQDVLSLKRESRRETVLGQEIDVWTAPAFFFSVVADNSRLGGGGLRIGATSDSVTQGKERFNRNLQSILRGQEVTYQLWGVAIDAGLEIEDEVATAIPFIAATFLVVLVVVGISLRSLRVLALTAVGLILMIIWLKGLSNLVGLQSSTTLDFIVPIAMISLGADFAIHAVHRYREEGRGGLAPRAAFRVGMAGVLTALSLAMLTDTIAFLANVTAQIETVVGFGIGAGLAILAAFIILGLTLPTVLMRLDARRHRHAERGEDADHVGDSPVEVSEPGTGHEHRSRLASVIVALARKRAVVLPAALVITAISAFYALQLEATFDVKDFFKGDSDFAVSLDKIDVHVGDSGGEPAIIYIQADLTDPSALAAIQDFYIGLSSNPYVATNSDGEASFNARPVFSIIEQAIASDYARAEIEKASGVAITVTGDPLRTFTYLGREHRWPMSRDQLTAIFDY